MRNLEVTGVQQRFVLILAGYREAPAQRRFGTVPGGPDMSLAAVQRRFGIVPGGPDMLPAAVQRRFGIVPGGPDI